jgi:hypothetical protein
MQWT